VDDARTGKRFPVHLPIKLVGSSAPTAEQESTTENISAAGVYLRVDQPLAVNSRVEFEITIPAPAIGADQDVVLHCVGRVVRTDVQSSENGVACLIDEYDFIRRGDGS
jgi:hypothetical protein